MRRGRNTHRAAPNPRGVWDVKRGGAAPDLIEVASPTYPQLTA